MEKILKSSEIETDASIESKRNRAEQSRKRDKELEKFINDWRKTHNTKNAVYSSYHYDAMDGWKTHCLEELRDDVIETEAELWGKSNLDKNMTISQAYAHGMKRMRKLFEEM